MGTATANCCKTCSDCPTCYDHSLGRLRDVLYSVNTALSNTLEQEACEAMWGYSQKRAIDKNKLFVFRRALQRHIDSVDKGYPSCLCPDEVQTILEDVLNEVGIACCTDPQRRDIIIDKSALSDWTLKNTGCVSFEEWEKNFKKACPVIGIKVVSTTTLEELTKFIYTLTISTLEPCTVLYNIKAASISIQEQCYDYRWTATPVVCDITALAYVTPIEYEKCVAYGLTAEQISECRLGYNLLVEKTNCDLSFGTYIDLLSCHLTTDIIANLIQCGINVSYSAKEQCPVLEIGKTSVHLYDDLDLTNLDEDTFSCDFQLLDIDG